MVQQLGIPTANIPLSGLSVGGHEDIESGVYFGWAGLSSSKATQAHPPSSKGNYKLMASDIFDNLSQKLAGRHNQDSSTADQGVVYPMVMSIGYNPVYKNTVRSVEVHVMHDFGIDFYGSHMNVIILGFIRPEYDYDGVESLIKDIKTDIDVSGRSLAREAYVSFASDPYLLEFSGKSEVAS